LHGEAWGAAQTVKISILCKGLVLACLLGGVATGCLGRQTEEPCTYAYNLATTITVLVGETVPGTNILYQGRSDKGAHVLIDGLEAHKRVGDSLDWSGSPIEGVTVDLTLRVVRYTAQSLTLVGVSDVTVEDAQPRVASIVTTSPIKYSGVVGYGVAVNSVIPGTVVRYEGPADEGAQLGSVEGYPYRKVGDSINWEGMLRDDVYISLAVRVAQFDEKGMRVAGTVTLWLGP